MRGWNTRAGFGEGMLPPAAARTLAGLLLVVSVAGCITINIYFPAAAAEKAADRIIDDVLGSGKGGADVPAPMAPVAPAAPAR